MYKCINCGKEFEKDYRKEKTIKNCGYTAPNFCSRTCARKHNGKLINYDLGKCENCGVEIKIRKGTKKKLCSKCLNKNYLRRRYSGKNDESIDRANSSLELEEKRKEYKLRKKENEENRIKNILSTDFNLLKWDIKRERILIEQENKCKKCGLSEWMGKPLSLEIDHKDGDNANDSRNNLEAICPNCHSITPTWRGRNAKKHNLKSKIKDEDLVEAFFLTGSIRQALLSVGLAAKGNNYGRVKRLLTQRGIKY